MTYNTKVILPKNKKESLLKKIRDTYQEITRKLKGEEDKGEDYFEDLYPALLLKNRKI